MMAKHLLPHSPLIDQNANREMFEEGVEVLFKAFEGKPFWTNAQGAACAMDPDTRRRKLGTNGINIEDVKTILAETVEGLLGEPITTLIHCGRHKAV